MLVAVFCGFAIYCTAIFFYGKSGFFELKAFETYRDRLVANNMELRETGASLHREAEILVSDSEVLALKARELGYLKENQGRISLTGYAPKEQSYALGKILKWKDKEQDRSLMFRTLSIGIGLFGSLLILLSGWRKIRRRN